MMNQPFQTQAKLMLLAFLLALNLIVVTDTAGSATLAAYPLQPQTDHRLNGNYPPLPGKPLSSTPFRAQNESEKWRDTGLLLPNDFIYCFDATHPGILLVVNTDPAVGPNGIYRYNWQTNQKSLLTPRVPPSADNHWACNKYNGLFFILDEDNKTTTRFSVDEPQARLIEHFPTNLATDGTLQLYSIDNNHKLWASSDGGLSWQERTQTPVGVKKLAVTRQNGQALYLLTKNENSWAIYFSADAGLTWEKRSEPSGSRNAADSVPTYSLDIISGSSADVNTLELFVSYDNPHIGTALDLSIDGGRTFNYAASYRGAFSFPDLYQTSLGIVLDYPQEETFKFTTNGGKDWQELTTPFVPDPDQTLLQAQNRPENLYFQGHRHGLDHTLWYSGDGGRNWQKLGPEQPTFLGVTPYAPTTLVGVDQANKLQILEQPVADKSLTKAALPSGLATAQFFPETGHNLQGVFLSYWQTHGGLAQFGYPKTEPFREYNPSDGKIYTVQYFERNRFEYHPENAGTANEVLLGLLGNQLTEQRRARGENAFKPVTDPHQENQLYFPQTGHTLSHQFKNYWETNGGLGLYGYPISEEFSEVNPDDGKTYTVQYFERNRFEYHPENSGTPYEVLLGLLGNSLLRLKGWL